MRLRFSHLIAVHRKPGDKEKGFHPVHGEGSSNSIRELLIFLLIGVCNDAGGQGLTRPYGSRIDTQVDNEAQKPEAHRLTIASSENARHPTNT